MSYNPVYQKAYYQLHNLRIQEYNKERLRARRGIPKEEMPQRANDYLNSSLYKRIKRAVGHLPQWWEIEYFQEEWR